MPVTPFLMHDERQLLLRAPRLIGERLQRVSQRATVSRRLTIYRHLTAAGHSSGTRVGPAVWLDAVRCCFSVDPNHGTAIATANRDW